MLSANGGGLGLPYQPAPVSNEHGSAGFGNYPGANPRHALVQRILDARRRSMARYSGQGLGGLAQAINPVRFAHIPNFGVFGHNIQNPGINLAALSHILPAFQGISHGLDPSAGQQGSGPLPGPPSVNPGNGNPLPVFIPHNTDPFVGNPVYEGGGAQAAVTGPGQLAISPILQSILAQQAFNPAMGVQRAQ